MTIQWDQPAPLPPLKTETPPVVSVDSLLAIADVHLPAADIPRGILRQFYESILGLTFIPPDPLHPPHHDAPLQFLHQRRRIILSRQPTAPPEAPAYNLQSANGDPPLSSFVSRLSSFPAPSHVAFLIKDFPDVLLRLRSHSIPYDLLHLDHGLTRTALLRDPAGNFVHLVETRPL